MLMFHQLLDLNTKPVSRSKVLLIWMAFNPDIYFITFWSLNHPSSKRCFFAGKGQGFNWNIKIVTLHFPCAGKYFNKLTQAT